MRVEVSEFTMGYRVRLFGDRDSFSAAVTGIQSAIPYALRRFTGLCWHVEKRGEKHLRSWCEQMEFGGANVIWREKQSEDDVRVRLLTSAKKRQEAKRSNAA